MTKAKRNRLIYTAVTFLLVIGAYLILQSMIANKSISRSLKGQLVPICCWIVMAVSLNLVIGISGELSLGHAGFMSVGAYTGAVVSGLLLNIYGIEDTALRLVLAIAAGGLLSGIVGALITVIGWGTEAVIIEWALRKASVDDECCLQIRQTTSALVHGVVILPLVRGWNFTFSLFHGTQWLIPVIAAAAVFASLSYHFYYHAIREVGTSRAMALNISYSAWAVIFSILFLKDYALLNPVTLACTAAVLLFGILAGTASRSSQV